MASIPVDANGKKIKTDILTAGYVRQEIENQYKILIPSEIKAVCFDYWFINVCDEWDTNYNEDRVDFKGQIAKSKGSIVSIYGSDIHDDNRSKYEWKLRLKFLENKSLIEAYIGVIQDKKEYLDKHLTDYDYDYVSDGYGCWVCTDSEFSNKGVETTILDKLDPSKQHTIGYGMKIDLNTKKIYFSMDNNDYVEAPYTLKGDRYRLVVTLPDSNIEVELL